MNEQCQVKVEERLPNRQSPAPKKTRTKISKSETKKRWFATALLAYPIIMFLIFGVYVQVSTIGLTFQKMDYLGHKTFIGFSNFFGNYIEFFKGVSSDGAALRISFFNSLKVWALCTIISNPLYIIFAYFIYKKCAGHRVVQTIVMLPEMISGLIFCLIFKQIVNEPLIEIMNFFGFKDFPNLLDSKDYVLGICTFYRIWVSFGTSTIFYSNAMAGIDKEVIESAQLDGVDNMFQELWYITLPLIFPTIKTLFVLGLASIFTTDNMLVTFFMYGAPPESWTMGYYNTIKIFNASSTGYPVIAAGGLVLTAIMTPLVIFIRKGLDKIDPCGI